MSFRFFDVVFYIKYDNCVTFINACYVNVSCSFWDRLVYLHPCTVLRSSLAPFLVAYTELSIVRWIFIWSPLFVGWFLNFFSSVCSLNLVLKWAFSLMHRWKSFISSCNSWGFYSEVCIRKCSNKCRGRLFRILVFRGERLFERGAYKKPEFLLFVKTFFNIIVRHKNKNTEDE